MWTVFSWVRASILGGDSCGSGNELSGSKVGECLKQVGGPQILKENFASLKLGK